MSELNRLLQRLCDAEIDFVIVGGFAAMLHGSALRPSKLNYSVESRVIAVDLIKAKQALGRDKDLLAVKELRAIVEKKEHEEE